MLTQPLIWVKKMGLSHLSAILKKNHTVHLIMPRQTSSKDGVELFVCVLERGHMLHLIWVKKMGYYIFIYLRCWAMSRRSPHLVSPNLIKHWGFITACACRDKVDVSYIRAKPAQRKIKHYFLYTLFCMWWIYAIIHCSVYY